MENYFDVNKYMNLKNQYEHVKLFAYPNNGCPTQYPISLGYVDGFSNGELNICAKVCNKKI